MSLFAARYLRDPACLASVETLFLQSVPGPSNKHRCARAAAGSFKVLVGRIDAAAITTLRLQFPRALDAAMAFVTQPRTSSEIHELAEGLKSAWSSRRCACDMSQALVCGVHEVAEQNPGPRAHDNPLLGLLDLIVPVMSQCVPPTAVDMRALSKANARAIRANQPTTWPVDVDTALPFGAKASLKALLSWAAVFEGPGLFMLILAASNLQGSHIARPIILSSPSVCSAFANVTGRAVQQWKERPEDPKILKRVIADLYHSVLFCSNVLFSASDHEVQRFAAQASEDAACLPLLSDQVLRLLDSHGSAIPSFPERELCITVVRDSFRVIGGRILGLLELPPDELHRYSPDIAAVSMHQTLFSGTPPSIVYSCLTILSRNGFCGARGCTTAMPSTGRKFALCAGCGIVPYCSKECQRSGWKDIVSPHKSMCRKLRSFSEVALGGRKFGGQDGAAVLEKMCRSFGVEDVLVVEVAEHLRSIVSQDPASGSRQVVTRCDCQIAFLWRVWQSPILDTVHQILICHLVCTYAVIDHDNLIALMTETWDLYATAYVIETSQLFYFPLYSDSDYFQMICSFAEFGGQLGKDYVMFEKHLWSESEYTPNVIFGLLGIGADCMQYSEIIVHGKLSALTELSNQFEFYFGAKLCFVSDSLIALSQVAFLWNHQSQISSINTALVTALCALGVLVAWSTMPQSLVYVPFIASLPTLLFNALLASLNARHELRETMHGDDELISVPLSGGTHTASSDDHLPGLPIRIEKEDKIDRSEEIVLLDVWGAYLTESFCSPKGSILVIRGTHAGLQFLVSPLVVPSHDLHDLDLVIRKYDTEKPKRRTGPP
ncbi:hypothetical protein CERSUDRAFT_77476 [Gelatoporia subvermispora B]|uniref:MYND-type domain-containing protein n=1 Tax=Ceriporiopsis subvermispora (strain B) TaxID=914234 RepID=M2Q6N6_CERS8|nr:hypothetical protein CERSUDRAFT_77476 [Gelatoporia subvermispora B]